MRTDRPWSGLRCHRDELNGDALNIDDAVAAKKALRLTGLQARSSLDRGERRRASATAALRLGGLPELRRARTVLLYAAFGEEADPSPVLPRLHARGVRTLFPRVRDDDLELVAARDLATLTLGYRGINEPVGPAIDPGVVDVAVIPGVAFDVAGGRLGQGGGHYDRLLPRLREGCLRVGYCFSCQLAARVPRLDHDEPVDVVVTERAVYRTHAREQGSA